LGSKCPTHIIKEFKYRLECSTSFIYKIIVKNIVSEVPQPVIRHHYLSPWNA
jgi:hypothetical protein